MKIKIRDFQSLGKVDLDVSGLTVLVGPSNRGKSAFIRAVTSALFNRPGEDFIRKGATQTQVMLDDLPTVTGTPMTVKWEKGHNLNRFTINGTTYDKVGQIAPDALVAAGYKDVFIGDKERNKGEEIRPQIGGQFDEPFLLKKLGSFINDVLSVVSRLGVLLNANGRCAKDLKAAKALLTVRQKDLKAADAKLGALQPVVLLHTRVAALQAQVDEAKRVETLLLKVRGLVAGRAALKQFVETTTLPEATVVPDEFGVSKLISGVKLARARAAAIHVKDLTLPKTVDRLDLAMAACELEWARVGQGRPLSVRRPALAATARLRLTAAKLVEQVTDGLPKLDSLMQTRATVKQSMVVREAATTAVYKAMSALDGVQGQELEADAALTAALATMDVCPVCDQPVPKAATAV